jgi:hypothetical protein
MRQLVWSAPAALVVALVLGAPIAAAEDVYLTPEERSRVVALVRADPRIRAVLDGREVRVKDVLPWSADYTRETLIGGGVTLAFSTPQTVEADWLLLDFPNGPDEYTITTMHYRVEGADAVDAWVDLRKDEVVSFDYLGGNVDLESIRQISPARAGASAADDRDDDGGPSRSALVAGLFLGSLLVSGIALGHRYGPVRE